MVKHQKCHGVSDVDAFINSSGLRLDQVQIVYGLGKFGGDYYVFYEAPDKKPSRRKPPEPDDKLELVPVDKTESEPDAQAQKDNPMAVKRVPGVHLTDEDIKDIKDGIRRLLNKMESNNGRNFHEDI